MLYQHHLGQVNLHSEKLCAGENCEVSDGVTVLLQTSRKSLTNIGKYVSFINVNRIMYQKALTERVAAAERHSERETVEAPREYDSEAKITPEPQRER